MGSAPTPAPVPDAAAIDAAEPDASSGSGSAAEGSGSAAFDFDKLTHQEKMDFMKTKVLPPMRTAFQKFDKKEYAKFNCKTCHGKDPQKSKFKMPNPELPKLNFAKIKAGKQAPEMAEFMEKTVEPDMAKILGKPKWSESTPNGFGCLDCHTEAKK